MADPPRQRWYAGLAPVTTQGAHSRYPTRHERCHHHHLDSAGNRRGDRRVLQSYRLRRAALLSHLLGRPAVLQHSCGYLINTSPSLMRYLGGTPAEIVGEVVNSVIAVGSMPVPTRASTQPS